MPNQSLMDEFQKDPKKFLESRALVCPGATTWELEQARSDASGAITKPALYLHQHLNIAKEQAIIATKKSFQATTTPLVANLDFFSMGGGDGSSGQIVGTAVDHTMTKQKGIIDKVMNVTCTGRSVVQLSIGLNGPGFPAYFLPWKSNNTMTMQLGDDASYFFTAAMTGCTFQITGSPEAPIVSHANAGGEAADLKVATMDTMLKEAIRQRLSPAQRLASHNLPVTRLQAGLWGEVGEKGIKELEYANDTGGGRAKAFQGSLDALQQDKSAEARKFQSGEMEVVDNIVGDARQLTVAVAGWRPPKSKGWEFFYQVWANYDIDRVVYRHEKKTLGGKQKRVVEKTKISDFVILEPGRRFWPGGAGWPDPTSAKLSR